MTGSFGRQTTKRLPTPTIIPEITTKSRFARTVYYCVDEWSMFGYLDRAQTVAAENTLLGKVDAVFAINSALASR